MFCLRTVILVVHKELLLLILIVTVLGFEALFLDKLYSFELSCIFFDLSFPHLAFF